MRVRDAGVGGTSRVTAALVRLPLPLAFFGFSRAMLLLNTWVLLGHVLPLCASGLFKPFLLLFGVIRSVDID